MTSEKRTAVDDGQGALWMHDGNLADRVNLTRYPVKRIHASDTCMPFTSMHEDGNLPIVIHPWIKYVTHVEQLRQSS